MGPEHGRGAVRPNFLGPAAGLSRLTFGVQAELRPSFDLLEAGPRAETQQGTDSEVKASLHRRTDQTTTSTPQPMQTRPAPWSLGFRPRSHPVSGTLQVPDWHRPNEVGSSEAGTSDPNTQLLDPTNLGLRVKELGASLSPGPPALLGSAGTFGCFLDTWFDEPGSGSGKGSGRGATGRKTGVYIYKSSRAAAPSSHDSRDVMHHTLIHRTRLTRTTLDTLCHSDHGKVTVVITSETWPRIQEMPVGETVLDAVDFAIMINRYDVSGMSDCESTCKSIVDHLVAMGYASTDGMLCNGSYQTYPFYIATSDVVAWPLRTEGDGLHGKSPKSMLATLT
ncbi:hypothetical protein BDK51DRAFT_51965 [Blyttiomyces helicus]|uniref:Uncharacterized protein n=1 Tax=Blyttiomyces helicus TaxID=388810 RepID=A0A4P9WB85_9FUNG|nr:hypothetical protein BDK51DRAFT_51965 [Blyttiomyces helicus]|eukprot:RKO87536.1 hypothetical protein BDK51DRAFT_51965 [Blyttiomyces helicus]